jgi:tetratricopeptide (TPR) repeat protein
MYKEDGIDAARKICERALRSVDMSLVKEKLNLWIAYMNLEFTFGQESKFQDLVKRAIKLNEPKDIYLAMINIYRKHQKLDIIEGIYQILIKKYSKDLDIWKNYIEFTFEFEALEDEVKEALG